MGKIKAHKNQIWIILNIICTLVYLVWRILFTVPLKYGMVSLIAGIALLVTEILGAFEAGVHFFHMYKPHKLELPEVPYEEFPDVDIFIATYNEPLELLYKTVNGCKHIDYPDKKKVHVYLCDDGKRDSVRKMAAEEGVHYLDRPDHKGAKAGNLNHAMLHSKSPLILTLDADMIPRRQILMHMVPFFVDEEIKNRGRKEEEKVRMGFVQSPQSFYNPDLFQYNLFSERKIPNEQDYFYRDIQLSRNKNNSVIYGGSNTLISRTSLEVVGGFYMKSITEDFATGILIQKEGFVCYAIDEVLASGLSPNDLKSLIKQRSRWGRGVISTHHKIPILFSRKLNWGQKANYLASILYWYFPLKRLIYILSPILFAVFGYMVIHCTFAQILIFWLPMYLTSNICLRMLSQNVRNTKWTSVYETVLFPFLLGPILLETFGISQKKFLVTNKEDGSRKKSDVLYTLPFLLLIALSAVGVVRCILIMLATNSINTVVILFWLIANLFSLVMAVFFISGRRIHRQSERVEDTVICTIEDKGVCYDCQSLDLSEGGIAVLSKKPLNLGKKVKIKVETERYKAELAAGFLYVDKKDGMWKYAFQIEDMGGCKEQYLQILYDRNPTLPQNLKQANSSFDDLRFNITQRAKAEKWAKRKAPRVHLGRELISMEGEVIPVLNYNFQYLTVPASVMSESFTVTPVEGCPLECVFEREVRDGNRLYQVINHRTYQRNEEKRKKIEEWLYETSCINEQNNGGMGE